MSKISEQLKNITTVKTVNYPIHTSSKDKEDSNVDDIKTVKYPIHTSSKDKEDSNVGIYNPLDNNPRHDDTCWSGIEEPKTVPLPYLGIGKPKAVPLPYVEPEPLFEEPKAVPLPYIKPEQSFTIPDQPITIPTPVKHGKEYVKDPPHYHSKCSDAEMQAIIDRINKRGYIQPIDVIDTFFKDNFNLGTVFRYISRLGEKDDELTEIDKAEWYLNHERENIIAKRK